LITFYSISLDRLSLYAYVLVCTYAHGDYDLLVSPERAAQARDVGKKAYLL
jgi:hypothetical protein